MPAWIRWPLAVGPVALFLFFAFATPSGGVWDLAVAAMWCAFVLPWTLSLDIEELRLRRARRREARRRAGACAECGYPYPGVGSNRCPECGYWDPVRVARNVR